MNNALLNEAQSFIEHCYEELGKSRQEIEERIFVIQNDIKKYGTYEHTFEELEYGAKLAWRNSNRCIGRLFWNSLHVIDKRNLNDKEEIKDALFNHIKYATNQGRIRSTITIFKQKRSENDLIKIWNHQLIRYAGYESKDGMIGDPDSIAFTKKCVELGWKGNNSHFDILPLVFQIDNGPPELATIPDDLIMEVPIQHPSYQWFKDLNLKWYAVPIISSMRLEIGGIHYTAAPFNGWYMGTEIGARNLADENRYNILPKIGLSLGLDIKRNSSLWKDRALIELNSAVLSSFKEHGVSIVDHHTAAQQFRLFEEKEHENGREATGNWTWLIPPISPATTHIFHKPYKNTIQKPNYFYQELPY